LLQRRALEGEAAERRDARARPDHDSSAGAGSRAGGRESSVCGRTRTPGVGRLRGEMRAVIHWHEAASLHQTNLVRARPSSGPLSACGRDQRTHTDKIVGRSRRGGAFGAGVMTENALSSPPLCPARRADGAPYVVRPFSQRGCEVT
jgi:hypothetical protein